MGRLLRLESHALRLRKLLRRARCLDFSAQNHPLSLATRGYDESRHPCTRSWSFFHWNAWAAVPSSAPCRCPNRSPPRPPRHRASSSAIPPATSRAVPLCRGVVLRVWKLLGCECRLRRTGRAALLLRDARSLWRGFRVEAIAVVRRGAGASRLRQGRVVSGTPRGWRNARRTSDLPWSFGREDCEGRDKAAVGRGSGDAAESEAGAGVGGTREWRLGRVE